MVRKVDCDNFESTVNELLDQRLPLGESVCLSSHVEECKECADLLIGYLDLERSLVWSASNSAQENEKLGLFDSGHYPVPESFFDQAVAPKGPVVFPKKELEHGRFGALGLVCSLALGIAILLGVLAQNFGSTNEGSLAKSNPENNATIDVAKERNQNEVKSLSVVESNPQTDSKGPENAFARMATSPVLELSNELPYVRPLKSSINVAIDFFQSFSESRRGREEKPDLGFRFRSTTSRV